MPFSFHMMHPRKTSDTLFVLGSSPSINAISDAQWELIGRHDSVGFNFSLFHPFVPTFYFWECPGETARRWVFSDLLRRKREAYRETPIVLKRVWPGMEAEVKEVLSVTPDLNHKLAISLDIPPKRNEQTQAFLKVLDHFERRGIGRFLLNRNLLWHRRGTLSELVAFACGMDYKRVVLCGVDLAGTDYFFDIKAYTWVGELLPTPPRVQASVHSTVDLSKNDLTIDEVLYGLHDCIMKSQGRKLQINTMDSRLYPRLSLCPEFA